VLLLYQKAHPKESFLKKIEKNEDLASAKAYQFLNWN